MADLGAIASLANEYTEELEYPITLLAQGFTFAQQTARLAGTSADGDITGALPAFWPNRRSVRGTLRNDSGVGISRKVMLFDKATGVKVTEATADGSGVFDLRTTNTRPVILVHIPNPGDNRNAVVLDNITPVAPL